jgi:hypothetical protein
MLIKDLIEGFCLGGDALARFAHTDPNELIDSQQDFG